MLQAEAHNMHQGLLQSGKLSSNPGDLLNLGYQPFQNFRKRYGRLVLQLYDELVFGCKWAAYVFELLWTALHVHISVRPFLGIIRPEDSSEAIDIADDANEFAAIAARRGYRHSSPKDSNENKRATNWQPTQAVDRNQRSRLPKSTYNPCVFYRERGTPLAQPLLQGRSSTPNQSNNNTSIYYVALVVEGFPTTEKVSLQRGTTISREV
ncbi:hypothetical protein L596_020659 [Steinernema carpocapsae]|uniref:Uncharacterized protein n=1 Tax=Steinernema carpocapsae TaxID=34508 RepID=A0A4U5MU95_STECR|nr:hypothetical protein L596_020659 [Steinernema carpocapsae]